MCKKNMYLQYMFNYIFEKIKDDYAMVSLDNTIGHFTTNVSLVCQLWIRRLYKHLIDNGYNLNINKFMTDHPRLYTMNSEL